MAPLTKEEKKARKEAKKLEALLREQELQKQLRRDQLKREMAAQAVRRSDLDKSWRAAMMKIKEPVFKQEVEVMWHIFERLYDKKNYLIKHLSKLIEIADDQFQRTISAFCDIIDNTILKFKIDLDNLAKENNRRTTNLLKWGENIRNKLKSDHDAAELHLQILLHHGHTTFYNYTWNLKGEHMVREDEERTNYLDVRDNLQSYLEDMYIKMWDEYKLVLKTYVQGTAENQKNVRRLRRKENIMEDIIDSQGKRLANFDKVLARLRNELSLYESGEKQAAYRDRRNRHRAAAHNLKKRLLDGLATDERRLATLVRCSDELTEWLEEIHKKSVKIMRLAGLCRKFETLREKVMPYGIDLPPESEQAKVIPRHATPSDESFITTALAGTTGLARLWNRVARADLGKRALLREKMLLERENAMIMEKLSEEGTPDLALEGSETSIKCICGDKEKPNIVKPVAVNGALEVAKYRKYYYPSS